MPGKTHDIFRRGLDVLRDVTLEGFIVQPEVCSLWVEVFFLVGVPALSIGLRCEHN